MFNRVSVRVSLEEKKQSENDRGAFTRTLTLALFF